MKLPSPFGDSFNDDTAPSGGYDGFVPIFAVNVVISSVGDTKAHNVPISKGYSVCKEVLATVFFGGLGSLLYHTPSIP
jgi:hypothetical protein